MASSFHSNDVGISDIVTYIDRGDIQLPVFKEVGFGMITVFVL